MLGVQGSFLDGESGQLFFDLTDGFVLSRLYLLDLGFLDLCDRLDLISASIKLSGDCLTPGLQLADQLPQLGPLGLKQLLLLLAVLHTV